MCTEKSAKDWYNTVPELNGRAPFLDTISHHRDGVPPTGRESSTRNCSNVKASSILLEVTREALVD